MLIRNSKHPEVIKEKCHIFDPGVANFQPFILDEMKTLWSNYLQKSVPYVADELSIIKQSNCGGGVRALYQLKKGEKNGREHHALVSTRKPARGFKVGVNPQQAFGQTLPGQKLSAL